MGASGRRSAPTSAWLAAITASTIAVAGGCSSGSTTGTDHPDQAVTETAAPVERPPAAISIEGARRQRIEGWGMTAVGEGRGEPIVSGAGLSQPERRRLDRLVFDDAGINLVRVFGPAPQTGGPRAGLWSPSDQTLRFVRRARRYGVRFMFTGGGAPPSMREGGSPQGALLPGEEAAYARYLARNLEVAQRSGARFTWTAIGNEPDIAGAGWVAMSPEQAAAVYRRLAREIRARGLAVKMVLGDNSGWSSTYEYARLEGRDGAVSRLASVVAAHDYTGLDPGSVVSVGRFARRRDLSLWMTEWTNGCAQGECADQPGDIGVALEWARRINYDLSVAGANAWFMFEAVPPSFHGPDSGVAVRDYGNPGQPFYVSKRYWVLRQFTSAAPPGARSYEVSSGTDAIGSVAFRRGRTTAIVLTNPGHAPLPVSIGLGGDRGTVTVRRTSATENFSPVGERRYDGTPFDAVLPAASVTTYRLRVP